MNAHTILVRRVSATELVQRHGATIHLAHRAGRHRHAKLAATAAAEWLASRARAPELQLHYQPRFDLASAPLRGAEARLRCKHKRRQVPPDEFMPPAEEWGLSCPSAAESGSMPDAKLRPGATAASYRSWA